MLGKLADQVNPGIFIMTNKTCEQIGHLIHHMSSQKIFGSFAFKALICCSIFDENYTNR